MLGTQYLMSLSWHATRPQEQDECIPLGILLAFPPLLYTALVPCSSSLSPSRQRSSIYVQLLLDTVLCARRSLLTLAPSTASSTSFLVAAWTISAAVYNAINKYALEERNLYHFTYPTRSTNHRQ